MSHLLCILLPGKWLLETFFTKCLQNNNNKNNNNNNNKNNNLQTSRLRCSQ